jgi:transcriptional regulator with XRE-family HTH domain
MSARQINQLLTSNMEIIGNNVRFYRKQKCFSQNELAYYVCSSQHTISNIETVRNYNVELLTLLKIAEVLEISIQKILTPRK